MFTKHSIQKKFKKKTKHLLLYCYVCKFLCLLTIFSVIFTALQAYNFLCDLSSIIVTNLQFSLHYTKNAKWTKNRAQNAEKQSTKKELITMLTENEKATPKIKINSIENSSITDNEKLTSKIKNNNTEFVSLTLIKTKNKNLIQHLHDQIKSKIENLSNSTPHEIKSNTMNQISTPTRSINIYK